MKPRNICSELRIQKCEMENETYSNGSARRSEENTKKIAEQNVLKRKIIILGEFVCGGF